MAANSAHACPTCGCGPECVIDTDNHSGDLSKWSQESGTWANASGRLDPPDSGGGYIRFLAAIPTTDTDGYKWSQVINFGSGNGTVRVCVDQVSGDPSTKIYAEVIAVSSASISIRLFNQISGTPTAFTSTKFLACTRSNDVTVSICVVGSRVTAAVRQGLSIAVVQNTTTLNGGDYVGTEVTTVHSSTRLDDAQLSRIGGSSECPNCDAPCAGCMDDSAPLGLQVDLSGFAGVLSTLNGTYIVPYVGCPHTYQAAVPCNAGSQEIGSGAAYRMEEFSESVCTAANGDPFTFIEVMVDLDMRIFPFGTGTELRIKICARIKSLSVAFPGLCSTQDFIFALDKDPAEDCFDIDDDAPYTTTTGGALIGPGTAQCGATSNYTSASAHVSVAA